MRRSRIILLCLSGLLLLQFVFIFLFPDFWPKRIGQCFVSTDIPQLVDAVFVLGGGAKVRGMKAASLWKEGFAPKVYCLGKPNKEEWAMMGFFPKEPNLTRQYLIKAGVPDSCVLNITQGTSTHEERELILSVCRSKQYTSVIVVSSEMHTLRIRKHFNERFQNAGVRLLIVGAQDTNYTPDNWWKIEEGLIFVNNEIIKHIYYFFKHT